MTADSTFTPDHIAQVAHEANRALQRIAGDDNPSPPWDDAPLDQRDSAIAGILTALNGATPEEQHDAWAAHKRADGWVYGAVKDAEAKTHPCLVPYANLPPEQRVKDAVYIAIVRAMAAAN